MTTHQKTAIQTDQQAKAAFEQASEGTAKPIQWSPLEIAAIERDARKEASGHSAFVKLFENRHS